MVNGSLDLAARAIVLQAFLFDEAKIGATKKFALQRQINRARGGSVVRRFNGTEQCHYVVTRVRIYHFLRAASVKAIVGALLALRANS